VLEHTYHPVEDLKKAYSALKPGGWVIIGIPNVESWEKSIFGPAWVGWELPRHLYLFPQKIIREILKSMGFRWEATKCISSSHAVLGLSLDFWSQGWQDKHPKLRKLLLRSYNSIFGRLLFLIPLWISDKFNRSTIIAFFAQKPAGID
jgi:predicted SAM-dependent methyltransferase